jgi:hypothetical protein
MKKFPDHVYGYQSVPGWEDGFDLELTDDVDAARVGASVGERALGFMAVYKLDRVVKVTPIYHEEPATDGYYSDAKDAGPPA